MVTSLFEHERIVTTDTKAKALRPLADKMITLAKRGDLHSRRQALSVLTKKSVTNKLFSDIKDRYMDISGGYTSLVKIGPRRGDAAPLTAIELIKPDERGKGKKKSKRKATPKKTAAPKADTKKKAPKEEAIVEVEAEEEAVEEIEAKSEAAEDVTSEQAVSEDESLPESAPEAEASVETEEAVTDEPDDEPEETGEPEEKESEEK